jgi:hypothetical protein
VKRSRIRSVSVRRQRENREYTKLRREFLESRPRCEFPNGCGERADTVQHLRGRRGARLNNVDYWAASCLAHNLWAEENTGEALAIGWLIRIEGVA